MFLSPQCFLLHTQYSLLCLLYFPSVHVQFASIQKYVSSIQRYYNLSIHSIFTSAHNTSTSIQIYTALLHIIASPVYSIFPSIYKFPFSSQIPPSPSVYNITNVSFIPSISASIHITYSSINSLPSFYSTCSYPFHSTSPSIHSNLLSVHSHYFRLCSPNCFHLFTIFLFFRS